MINQAVQFTPGDVLTWVAVVVAVVFGARGGLQRSTNAAQKELIEAYETREAKHQEELAQVRTEREAKDAQTDAALKRLGERNTYLEQLLLRKVETEGLIKVMRDHDAEATTRHLATIQLLSDMHTAQSERIEAEQKLIEAINGLNDGLKNGHA